jgi:hypothetical protein
VMMNRKRIILLYAASWGLIIGCVTLNTFFSHHIDGHHTLLWKSLVRAVAFCSFWIVSLPAFWQLSKRFPFAAHSWKKPLAIHSAVAILVALLIVPFRVGLDLIPGVGVLPGGPETLFRYYAATLPARSVILYAVFLAASQALLLYRESVRQAGLTAELREKLAELVESTPEQGQQFAKHFTLKESGRIFTVTVEQIDWIEAAGNYASLHVNARTHLVRETMNAIETKLDPERFTRVQRSAIVQLDRVRELRTLGGGKLAVVLRHGTQIILGRAGKQRLESLIPQLRLTPASATPSQS